LLKQGNCGYVLPRHQNIKYIDLNVGSLMGVVDIVGDTIGQDMQDAEQTQAEGINLDSWINRKE